MHGSSPNHKTGPEKLWKGATQRRREVERARRRPWPMGAFAPPYALATRSLQGRKRNQPLDKAAIRGASKRFNSGPPRNAPENVALPPDRGSGQIRERDEDVLLRALTPAVKGVGVRERAPGRASPS
jgi:hypothetical protein